MHVLFISSCEGKALNRTRRLLDRYSARLGDRAWATPITTESLAEIHQALRKQASKNTCVACYLNDYASQMTLQWVVGRSSHYDRYGRYIMSLTSKPLTLPPFLQAAGHLAFAAGIAHDWGKANRKFQQKLRGKGEARDAVRHEWLSYMLMNTVLASKPFGPSGLAANYDALYARKDEVDRPLLKTEIRSSEDALLFTIVTHHKLYAGTVINPDAAGYIRNDGGEATVGCLTPYESRKNSLVEASFEEIDALSHLADSLDSVLNSKYRYHTERATWESLSIIGRAALILADHNVSSRVFTGKLEDHDRIYANTAQVESAKAKKRGLNQPLPWHLKEVGRQARENVRLYDHRQWPGLSQKSVDGILARAPDDSRFVWQDKAVDHLKAGDITAPTLILNVASTGSGKTRANAKLIAALGHPNRPTRFSSVFNLRTLTLQTRDAYRDELKMDPKELNCVIGDPTILKLHDTPWAQDDAEGNSDEFKDTLSEPVYPMTGNGHDCPEVFRESLRHLDQRQIGVLSAPVLVSTADQLIAAGDLSRQGHHASALVRIANSDLIIDEADSYDPKALMAVLRCVEMAAMFGRHVVVSTATLPCVLLDAIVKAWGDGIRRHAALQDNANQPSRMVWVGDRADPLTVGPAERADLRAAYIDFMRRNAPPAGDPVVKEFSVARLPSVEKDDWLHTCMAACRALHGDHHTSVEDHLDVGVSIGLVRMANVRPCQEVAKHIRLNGQREDTAVFVTLYHARELLVRRFVKERGLDTLLRRKDVDDPQWWKRTAETRKLVERAIREGKTKIMFVVVATPVEEVGRDHDFDWAVIDPSSLISIIQAAGRVNRHRLAPIDKRNIIVVNTPSAQVWNGRPKPYQMPGFAQGDGVSTHRDGTEPLSASELLGVERGKTKPLDISLAVGREGVPPCRFQGEDEKGIGRIVDSFFGLKEHTVAFLCHKFYAEFPLRDASNAQTSLFVDDDNEVRLNDGGAGLAGLKAYWDDPPVNTFLCMGETETRQALATLKLSAQQGLSVQARLREDSSDDYLMASWTGVDIE